MEHFAVVQSMARAALAGDKAAVSKQIERLRERLAKVGALKEAATLGRLLEAVVETRELAPSRVEVSRALVTGERLTSDISPPIDRETGAQLCSIDFVKHDLLAPIFSPIVSETVNGLLQEWGSAAALQSLGVDPTRTLLIYGPPGSGKTITAHHIARKLDLPIVTAKIDGLISSFLGTTARNIANLFNFASRYACVLLLDEFDALAKLRDDPQEIGEIKRVVNTLLQNLDLRREFGITIAITNHDRLLDPAVWRRFDTQVHMDEPEAQGREELIARFLKPVEAGPATWRIFAYCLAGRSGADLERTCSAVKRVIALKRDSHDGPALFRALSDVLARSPQLDHLPARILAKDPDAFVSLIANDAEFGVKQAEIGDATGLGQSKVSDLKKSKRHQDPAYA